MIIKKKITDRITTKNRRKWALIEPSFTEELIIKWVQVGLDYDIARKWLGVLGRNNLPLEIHNVDFYSWLQSDCDLSTPAEKAAAKAIAGDDSEEEDNEEDNAGEGSSKAPKKAKTTKTITKKKPTVEWVLNYANWEDLRKWYNLFVAKQLGNNPSRVDGRYTGIDGKPTPRMETLPRELIVTHLWTNLVGISEAEALIPYDYSPELNTLDEWNELGVLEDEQLIEIKKHLEDQTKEMHNLGWIPGLSNYLTKKYGLMEVIVLLKSVNYEKVKAKWIKDEEAKGVAIPLHKYNYLQNPTYVLHKAENPPFIEWGTSVIKNN